MFSDHGHPGHEVGDAVGWVIIGQFGQRGGQPFMRMDGIELAAFNAGGDHRPVVAALVRTSE